MNNTKEKNGKNGKMSLTGQLGPLTGKTILMVNTGSFKKRFIVQKLKKLGLTVVILNKEKNWAQPYVDYWILADNTSHSEALQAVQAFLASNPQVKINGVLTFWEDDVLLTSKIVDKFNFIGISYNITKKVRNKYLFREFCFNNKLPAPKFHLIKGEEDLRYIYKNFEFPVVLKPAYGASSAFVIKVETKENLKEMYQYVRSNISSHFESALTDGLDIFVEEFIDGDEVDVDILLQNGKVKFSSIADNYNKSKGIFFMDSGQAIPSSLPVQAQEELLLATEEILEKLGIMNGCIHFEAKYTKKGVYPIELNVRMGGDYVYSYNKSAWGVDLIEYAVKIALGEYIYLKKQEVPKKYIIGWDLHPDESGVLVELDVPEEEIKKCNFIEEMQFYKDIGDPIFVPPAGFEYTIGWMTVSGENLLDAKDNLNAALELISYKVVKFESDSFLGKTERKDRFSPAVLSKTQLVRSVKLGGMDKMDLKKQRSLHIGLLGNIYPDTVSDPIAKRLTLMVKDVEKALRTLGYKVIVLNLNEFPEVIDRIKRSDIDLVFNVGERLYNKPEYKPHIVALLESLHIPCTGSNPFTMSLSVDKIRFKQLLQYHEIPTPEWDYLYRLEDELSDELEFPLIVKPATTDDSIGISRNSVVTSKKGLNSQLEKVLKTLKKPALVEEYIEGDEYEVYILGNKLHDLKVLPLCRTIFDGLPKDYWHMYTFDSKWGDKKKYKEIVRQLPPRNISKKLQSLITEIALDTYSIFDCRDYGKVEVKVDEDGNPYVLELDTNPWLSTSADEGIVAAAKLMKFDYAALLEEIIKMAVERFKRKLGVSSREKAVSGIDELTG